MERNFEIKPSLPTQFIIMKTKEEYKGVREHCTLNYLKNSLKDIKGLSVESVILNETGIYEEDPKDIDSYNMGIKIDNLPSYFRIILKKEMPGGHKSTIWVYLPLVWNERFLGLTGGGSQSRTPYAMIGFCILSNWVMGIKNHFACAETDCDIKPGDAKWGFKKGTNELDWDHLREWGYEAAHDVALIGKYITEIVYKIKPKFSYLAGTSAGGRTTLGEIQRYPEDYDGYISNCPATPWTLHLLNQSWPLFVMNNEKHPVSKVKLETFYKGLLTEHNMVAKGYLTDCIFTEFDPYKLVGTETSEGKITKEDADVMKKIYDGPKFRDGRKMYGCDFMGPSIKFWEIIILFDEKGQKPLCSLSDCALQTFRWALRNPELKWEEITYEDIEKIYQFGVSEGKDLDNLDPDLRRFKDLKKKMILLHATADFCCSLETTLKYYNDIMYYTSKSEKELKEFALCYVSMGGGHNNMTNKGELMSYPDVFAALIHWVEDNIVPSELPAMKSDEENKNLIYSGRKEKPYSFDNPENAKIKK